MIGEPGCTLVEGALRSARAHSLEHAVLSADDIRERFPVLHAQPEMVGVWEPHAGVLSPEACVAAQLEQARQCAQRCASTSRCSNGGLTAIR
jgi:sarcosine oxidase